MSDISRKQFIKTTCMAACVLVAGGLVIGSFEGCSTIKVYKSKAKDGKIAVPLTEFAIEKMRIVRVETLPYDIMLIKKDEKIYKAFLMRCTHQDFALTANERGFNCSNHGSAFDLDGKVTNGPANEPLKELKVSVENGVLYIY